MVEVADTPTQRDLGLGGRSTMDENQGMLFIFDSDKNSTPTFWMKGMEFDLDLVWIENGRVVDITESVPSQKKLRVADSELPTYTAPQPVTEVLELNAGFCQRHQVKIGDEVTLEGYRN